jgi:hypothetical protein
MVAVRGGGPDMTGIPESSRAVSADTHDPDQLATMDGVRGLGFFSVGAMLTLLAAAFFAA